MRRLDITSKAIILLTALSVAYSALDLNIIFLAPIITIAIPYRFMTYKESEKYNKNRNILNNLFSFNIISFIAVAAISKHMNQTILDITINILVSFIYYRITCNIENKKEYAYKNPEFIYEKLEQRIYALESVKVKLEKDIEYAKTEKDKSSIQMKLNSLNQKILQDKSQLEIIKIEIDSKNNDLR